MQNKNLRQQAVTLVEQLPAEKLKTAFDYLTSLKEEVLQDSEVPQKGLGTAIHEMFKPFGGVELEIPPRASMRGGRKEIGYENRNEKGF